MLRPSILVSFSRNVTIFKVSYMSFNIFKIILIKIQINKVGLKGEPVSLVIWAEDFGSRDLLSEPCLGGSFYSENQTE